MSSKERIRAAIDRARGRRELAKNLPDPATRRAIRERAMLTQDEVGEAIGVSRQAIARYETGDRAPNAETSRRYVELLDGLRRDEHA